MKFRLNRKALERLKALVRAGQYVDRAWSFSVADSNALLGNPANWTEYQQWFLGIEMSRPDSVAENGASNQTPHKDWYTYPFGDGDVVNLDALRGIASQAKAAGDNDIATAAGEALALIAQIDKDNTTATACNLDIRFGAPARIQAAAGKKLPTFDADAYTGGPMQLEGWTHPVVIDYDGIDFSEHSRPVLRDHDPKLPLGHTTSFGVADGILKSAGVISAAGKHVDEVVEAAKNKFPWQVSVGAKVIRNQFVPEGESAQANGRVFAGPVNIARQTALREISILTLGADDNTSARIAASAAKKGSPVAQKLKKKFAAWAKARGIQMADMEDDGVASSAKSLYKAQMKCEADDANDEDDDGADDKKKGADSGAPPLQIQASAAGHQSASQTAAADFLKEIRATAANEAARMAKVNATLEEYRPQVEVGKFTDIQAKAISGEYNQEKMELELIRARRPTAAPMINTGAGSQLTGNMIAAAACMANGMTQKMACAGLDERAGNIASSRQMRGTSLHGIISAVAPGLGIHARAGGIDRDFLDDFLPADRAAHRRELRAARASGLDIQASSGAGFATMSLTGVLENIMNKMMLEQYGLQLSVVSDIAFERDTNDFRPFKVYRLTASGDLEPVGPGGEIKTMSLQDESYGNQVLTKAALIPIKREDIMNDDMGAITQTPVIAGRKGALNREKSVFTTFLSGLTTVAPGASVGKTANAFNFWSTGAKNYLSGGGSALSITSLTSAAKTFVQQTDANGDPIMSAPDRVLCAPENYDTAKALYSGASIVVGALGATNAKSLDPNYNVHAGAYRPIRSPFLGGSSPVTGASATQWALLTNPAGGMATVQVGYLRGQRTPIIRQVDVDATMLGLAYQIIFDFGVALLDYRCGVYSAGA